ncbi:MAG: hypothetical protein MJZ61_03150 [Bacteroidales bacterium]|nr:hypothetical protein [Bacteroidales bacterium]
MRNYRNNEMDYTTFYMSFVIDPRFKDDLLKSVWNYAREVSEKGMDFFKRNLITCKSANNSTIHWEYEEAQEDDWFCKFCCGAKKSDIIVNGFMNSRRISENDTQEICFVRLAICNGGNSAESTHNWFNARTGILANYKQAQAFDDVWVRVSANSNYDCMVKFA